MAGLALSFMIFGFTSGARAVSPVPVMVRGKYVIEKAQFIGSALYSIPVHNRELLLFHLPPEWYRVDDKRVEYQLRLGENQYAATSRNDLMSFTPPAHDNAHLPRGIQIQNVTINGVSVHFRVKPNPLLLPGRNSSGSLLEIPIDPATARGVTRVRICFMTRFNPLPPGFRRLLWDFVPRPVSWNHGRPDLRSVMPPILQQTIHIEQIDSDGRVNSTYRDHTNSPTTCLLADQWDFDLNPLRVSYDSYLGETEQFLRNRVGHVVSFLKRYHVFNNDKQCLKLVFWDGSLTVSGNTVLLPRRLYRYPSIFFKQFEVTLLNGVIKALILKRFAIDTNLHPWIVPAIQSEVVRQYFNDRFNGDSNLFPWLDWINPEYFSDISVRPWLENLQQKKIVGADRPKDISYHAHIHHPGFEKGSHLLWILHDGQADYRNRLIKRIFGLLNQQLKERELLTADRFFTLFTASNQQVESGKNWLSRSGRVDYILDRVQVKQIDSGYQAEVHIRNNGTLSPVLEIGFYFDDDHQEFRQVQHGEGVWTFVFQEKPDQVILDPAFNILDDNPVNNRWQFPLRTRPVWDFAPPDIWLFTISPLVGEGNTFDQNILGLNLAASYMSRTILQLNFWKGSDSNNLLWSGEASHIGFPFLGSQIYLNAGYLGAVSSATFGFKQETFENYPGLWIDTSLWKERLDDLDDDAYDDDQLDWAGFTITSEFPVFRHAYHLWQMKLMARSGTGLFKPSNEYHQLETDQVFKYDLNRADIHLGYRHGFSSGTVPLQHRFPIGGTEGLSGFPRDEELLFKENRIFEIGTTLPALLTHTDINLLGLMWLNQIVPTVDVHYGQGISDDSTVEEFADVELSVSIEGEFINRFSGQAQIAIAQPIGHEEYTDYRVILFSNWVF